MDVMALHLLVGSLDNTTAEALRNHFSLTLAFSHAHKKVLTLCHYLVGWLWP